MDLLSFFSFISNTSIKYFERILLSRLENGPLCKLYFNMGYLAIVTFTYRIYNNINLQI